MIVDLVRWVRCQFRRPEGRNARRATRGPRLESLEDRTAPATLTWTGAGANANWSTRANWDLRAPRQGDSLVFPDGPAQVVANNNLPGMILRSISFSGTGYSLTGRPVALTHGIQQTSAATGDANVVGLKTIVLPRTEAFSINGTADVKVTSNILGAVRLFKDGTGTLSLEGGKAFLPRGLVVRAGELEVAPLTSPAIGFSRITVRSGAKLTGTGMTSTVLVQSGGTLSPADAEVGALRTRSVTFSPNSTFRIDLDEAASPNLDQLSVRGRAVITGSTLAATGVYGTGIATSYTILDNDGGDRVVGRFAGLEQGARLRVPGPDGLNPEFSIDYFGGDGNDIVLTHENSAPEGDALSITTTEGTPRAGQVTAIDVDGDELTYSKVTDPEHGSVVVNLNGTFTYTPDDGYIGPDSFTFKANDGTADSELETVSITVNPINAEPSFTAGPGQTALEDSGPHTVEGWATELSPGPAYEADQDLTFNTTNNNNALFSVQPAVSPNGTLTYTLAPNANGSATVTVVLKDDGGTDNGGDDTSAPQTFTITVTPVNDAPSFAVGPNQTPLEGSGTQILPGWATPISPGPADESGQSVTFSVTNNNNALFTGQPTIAPNGMLTYTLAPNANGSATVTVTLSDNGGTDNGGDNTSDPQTFTITVTSVNDAPSFAVGGNQTVLEDASAQTVQNFATAISPGQANESGQSVTFSVTNNNNALFTGQPTIAPNGTLTYTLAPNANGSATVTVVLKDDGGTDNGGDDTSAPQTFTITVTPVNDAPSFARGPNLTVAEDSGSHIEMGWATAISPGPADESGQSVTFSVTTNNDALFTANGRPAISPDGTLTYTFAPNANGSATVTVTLSDNGGVANGGDNTSDPQSFTITVTPVGDGPVNSAPSSVTAQEDVTFPFSGANAVSVDDADGNLASVRLTVLHGTLHVSTTDGATAAGNDTATLTVSGTQAAINAALATLAYKGDPNYNAPDSLSILSTDSTPLTGSDAVAMTVTTVNDAPSFTKGPDEAVNEDSGAHTLPGWATAISAGPANESSQTLTFNVSTSNDALFTANGKPAIDPASGELTYTLAPNAHGAATVTITLSDNGGTANGGVDTSASRSFTLTVMSVNDAPQSADNTVATLKDTDYAFTAANFGFSDPNDSPVDNFVAVVITTLPTNGTLKLGSAPVTTGQFIAKDDIDAGQLRFSPDAGATGTPYASFTFQVVDGGGQANGGQDIDPSPSTMAIDVTAIHHAPEGTDNPVQALEDTDYVFSVANFGFSDPNDSPADQLLNVIITTLPADGTLKLDGVAVSQGQAVSASAIAERKLTFITDPNGHGTPYTAFTFQVQDDGDGQDTDLTPNSLTIHVTSVNDAPAGTDKTVTTAEDTDHVFTAANFGFSDPNDSPANNFVAVVITTLPTNGTLKLNGGAVTQGQSISKTAIDGGQLRFSPAANATGAPYTSFTFRVVDDGGQLAGGQDTDQSPNTMTINVTAVNDAPTVSVPSTQTATADEDRTFSTGSGNAITVADVDGNPLTVTIKVTGHLGSVALTLFQPTGLTGVTGNGTASVSFTGSVANINAALNGLTFNDDTAETGLTFTITVNDGTAPVVSDSFTINVNA